MSTGIERVRFYERQYLRSYDLTAEQAYHLEMRRRLNLALHDWGIVDGLEPLKGVLVEDAPEEFYISGGMAIDGYGREILMSRPYRLTTDDLIANEVDHSGAWELWLAYDRVSGTPPEAGYRLCDIADQHTRWLEGFTVILRDPAEDLDTDWDKEHPDVVPELAGELPDDTGLAPWPVRLGTVQVSNASGTLAIVNVDGSARRYVGLRTQRIVAPVYPDPATVDPDPEFKVLPATEALDSPLSIDVRSNLFAARNVIVGPNFEVDPTKIEPAPVAPFPDADGNVKIAADLFLKGDMYARVADKWLGLAKYIRMFIPEIVVGTQTVVPVPNFDPSSGTEVITVTTSLPSVSESKLVLSLTGIERLSRNDRTTWETFADSNASVSFSLAVMGPPSVNGSDHSFTIQWSVGPRSAGGAPPPPMLFVKSLTISYIAVFVP